MNGDQQEILLSIRDVTKVYPGVKAVNNLSLDIKKGEIHIIVGENGAGKSTLVKIIAGLIKQSAGDLVFEGEKYSPNSVLDAQKVGINMIHQELNLMQDRTVAQNVFVSREPVKTRLRVVDTKKMNSCCNKILADLGLCFDASMLIKDLSIAQQQMVEVAKAVSRENKLLIMDEPTSSLTQKEIDHLFAITRLLKSQGTSIIYISHRMQELIEIGDRITVMRDGALIATKNISEISMPEIIKMMVGRKIENVFSRTETEAGGKVLSVNNLTGLRFRNVSISIREGEIVGIAGLIGAGRTELAKAIYGKDRSESGEVLFYGKKINRRNYTTRNAVDLGISFIPEDRKAEGLFSGMSIKTNMMEASWRFLFRRGIVKNSVLNRTAEEGVKRLNVATPSIEKNIDELSGGNQQKVIISKWLVHASKLFIFDEPTRGIDVGAKSEIYSAIDELSKKGGAVLMISSDLPELLGMADRIYVMKDGEICGEVSRNAPDFTQEKVLAIAIGESQIA